MICKKCGNENRNAARFCNKCGATLEKEGDPSDVARESVTSTLQPESLKPNEPLPIETVKYPDRVPPPPTSLTQKAAPIQTAVHEKKASAPRKTPLIMGIILVALLFFSLLLFFGARFILSRGKIQKELAATPEATTQTEPGTKAFTKEELNGSWITEPFQDGTYWVLEFRDPEYLAQEVVFFTGEQVPSFESIPGLWSSGAWSNLEGTTYGSIFSLDGSVLTLGEFPLGSSYRLEKIDDDTMRLDDGSGSSMFGTMRRFSDGP